MRQQRPAELKSETIEARQPLLFRLKRAFLYMVQVG